MTLVRSSEHFTLLERADLETAGPALILEPGVPGLAPKVVTDDLAELWHELQQPRELEALSVEAQEAIAPLVLDGVFTVGIHEPTTTGPAAIELLDVASPPAGSSHTAQLSLRALAHAERRAMLPVAEIAAVLYRFNSEPASAYWHDRLQSESALSRAQQIFGPLWPNVTTGWMPRYTGDEEDGAGWVFCAPRRASRESTRFKIYVSTPAADLPESVQRAAAILADHGHPPFKFGSDVGGLLRPDKFVAYFPTAAAASRAGIALDAAIGDLAVQGVPFTHQIGDSGAVSAGVDPNEDPFGLHGRGNSWRYKLCRELAQAVKTAAAFDSHISPAEFAMHRLRLAGVDTSHWTPQEWTT